MSIIKPGFVLLVLTQVGDFFLYPNIDKCFFEFTLKTGFNGEWGDFYLKVMWGRMLYGV